jgi:hypothetical protein
MRAILSDIHGNLEALQAVLAASRQHVTSVYNLGDTTGYGPNPIECLDLAMGMEVCVRIFRTRRPVRSYKQSPISRTGSGLCKNIPNKAAGGLARPGSLRRRGLDRRYGHQKLGGPHDQKSPIGPPAMPAAKRARR